MSNNCCKAGFKWDGQPKGTESKLAGLDTYVSGSNKEAAVLIIHDVYGWTFRNLRLLADHYAEEADATVYLPDFFGGEVIEEDTIADPKKFAAFDLNGFLGRNPKDLRQPEIFASAKALKQEHGFKKVGAVGFCYGGWAVFRLAAKGNNLVDCISTAHPSGIEKTEVDNISVPVQICAPEKDPVFTPELKEYCNRVIPTLNIDYDYQYFPGLVHGFATRGDIKDEKQKVGLERAKNVTVNWLQQYLH